MRSGAHCNVSVAARWTDPVGRSPDIPFVHLHDFVFGATIRNRERRVVTKVESHLGGLLAFGSPRLPSHKIPTRRRRGWGRF